MATEFAINFSTLCLDLGAQARMYCLSYATQESMHQGVEKAALSAQRVPTVQSPHWLL